MLRVFLLTLVSCAFGIQNKKFMSHLSKLRSKIDDAEMNHYVDSSVGNATVETSTEIVDIAIISAYWADALLNENVGQRTIGQRSSLCVAFPKIPLYTLPKVDLQFFFEVGMSHESPTACPKSYKQFCDKRKDTNCQCSKASVFGGISVVVTLDFGFNVNIFVNLDIELSSDAVYVGGPSLFFPDNIILPGQSGAVAVSNMLPKPVARLVEVWLVRMLPALMADSGSKQAAVFTAWQDANNAQAMLSYAQETVYQLKRAANEQKKDRTKEFRVQGQAVKWNTPRGGPLFSSAEYFRRQMDVLLFEQATGHDDDKGGYFFAQYKSNVFNNDYNWLGLKAKQLLAPKMTVAKMKITLEELVAIQLCQIFEHLMPLKNGCVKVGKLDDGVWPALNTTQMANKAQKLCEDQVKMGASHSFDSMSSEFYIFKRMLCYATMGLDQASRPYSPTLRGESGADETIKAPTVAFKVGNLNFPQLIAIMFPAWAAHVKQYADFAAKCSEQYQAPAAVLIGYLVGAPRHTSANKYSWATYDEAWTKFVPERRQLVADIRKGIDSIWGITSEGYLVGEGLRMLSIDATYAKSRMVAFDDAVKTLKEKTALNDIIEVLKFEVSFGFGISVGGGTNGAGSWNRCTPDQNQFQLSAGFSKAAEMKPEQPAMTGFSQWTSSYTATVFIPFGTPNAGLFVDATFLPDDGTVELKLSLWFKVSSSVPPKGFKESAWFKPENFLQPLVQSVVELQTAWRMKEFGFKQFLVGFSAVATRILETMFTTKAFTSSKATDNTMYIQPSCTLLFQTSPFQFRGVSQVQMMVDDVLGFKIGAGMYLSKQYTLHYDAPEDKLAKKLQKLELREFDGTMDFGQQEFIQPPMDDTTYSAACHMCEGIIEQVQKTNTFNKACTQMELKPVENQVCTMTQAFMLYAMGSHVTNFIGQRTSGAKESLGMVIETLKPVCPDCAECNHKQVCRALGVACFFSAKPANAGGVSLLDQGIQDGTGYVVSQMEEDGQVVSMLSADGSQEITYPDIDCDMDGKEDALQAKVRAGARDDNAKCATQPPLKLDFDLADPNIPTLSEIENPPTPAPAKPNDKRVPPSAWSLMAEEDDADFSETDFSETNFPADTPETDEFGSEDTDDDTDQHRPKLHEITVGKTVLSDRVFLRWGTA